jgi:hypothetical protein
MRPTTAAGASGAVAHGIPLPEQSRRPNLLQRREARARRVRGLVACVIFAGMFAIGWMISNKPPVSKPVEEVGPKPPVEKSAGWIVQELPDGQNCNYTVFDNITQQVGEATTDACQTERRGPGRGFSWGRN